MGADSFKVGRPGQGVDTLATGGFSDLVGLKFGPALPRLVIYDSHASLRHFIHIKTRVIKTNYIFYVPWILALSIRALQYYCHNPLVQHKIGVENAQDNEMLLEYKIL